VQRPPDFADRADGRDQHSRTTAGAALVGKWPHGILRSHHDGVARLRCGQRDLHRPDHALPDAVRGRRYSAEFADGTAALTAADGTGNKVQLGGVDGYLYPGLPLMTLKGNQLTIVVPPYDGGGYIVNSPTCAGGDYWWEVLDRTPGRHQVFESCGTWAGTVEDSGRIEGTINGTFAYYKGTGPNWTTDLFCRATDHRFTIVKR
jgi:hypothetical protein